MRVVCTSCGAAYPLKSEFELEGPCSDCGEETLVEEDAYDPEPQLLRCVTCRRELQGGATGTRGLDEDDADWYEGRYSVDDACPLCGGELVPKDEAPPVRQQAEYRLARGVASKLRGSSLRCDPVAIAKAQGLEVVIGPFDHEGKLVDGRVIEVPEVESVRAQRWAVAHELGHAVLRHQVPEDRIEHEANAFASELLIPRKQLKRLVGEGLGFREIANTCDVSHQALGWALASAHLTEKVQRR
jgi:rRNA maturation protein Nop10